MQQQRPQLLRLDFAELNESGGTADSAPKTRGGAIGGCGVRDDAVPESGGVRPAGFSSRGAPDESMFEGAGAEADDGCSAGAVRARLRHVGPVSDCGAVSAGRARARARR